MEVLIGKKGTIQAFGGFAVWQVTITDPTMREQYGKEFAISSENLMDWMIKLEVFTDGKGHSEIHED